MRIQRLSTAHILFFILFCLLGKAQAQYIIMPSNGDTTITINSGSTYYVYDPGGPIGNYSAGTSTMTIKSSDGRPFTISGDFDIGSAHCLTIYDGESTRYPIEGFYSGTGNIKHYCPSGAITFHFFRTPSGRRPGFNFSICFPSIYNVHVDSTNSTYTHMAWNAGGYNSWRVEYFQTNDPTRSTLATYVNYTPFHAPQALAPGTEYTYHIRPRHYYMSYYDTSDYCYAPPHKFRTPKVANCNTCGHNRECIEYNNFYAEQVICFKGNTYKPDSAVCVSPTQHVLVNDVTAFDPRTGNQLRLVPEGDTASVRLGNPENGHEGESILYELHIDTNDYDLMVLRYATVIKLLNTRLKHEKPRFTIRLFDENCLPIQPLCYCRDILDDENTSNWDTSSYNVGGNTDTYIWRDWTSMGIDVSPFHGKTIYLQLSTHDGTSTGSAYAYFTLHCSRKQIDHLQQCADNISNTFYAPEGFNYRWYNASNPDSTLSTSISLQVSDSGLYQCWISPIECFDESCGYTISALAVPRFPYADFDSIITTSSCSFNVRFINRSFIADAYGNPLWTNEDCETAFWDFGNGQTSTNYNAEAVYTAAGTYDVTLIVGIAGGQCTDTITKQITLVWAHQTPRLEGDSVFCPPPNELELTMYNTTSCRWEYTYDGESWTDNSTTLSLDDITAQTLHCYVSDSNECNYHYQIPISILPSYNYTVSLSRCQAQLPLTWRDTTFDESTMTGNYVFHRQTVNLCDSTVTLQLTVLNSYNRFETIQFCDYITTYTYNDTVFDTIGNHTVTYSTASGCDSIIHLTIAEYDVARDTIRDTIFKGETYDSTGFHITAAETQTIGLITRNLVYHLTPCDSFSTLLLTVLPNNIYTYQSQTICADSLPITWNDVVFDTTVTDVGSVIVHTLYFPLPNGADSVVVMTLNINPVYNNQFYDTLCRDVLPYMWNGLTFDTDTTTDTRCQITHSTTLTTADGCDSTVALLLSVNPIYDNHYYDTLCNNQLPYIWNALNFDTNTASDFSGCLITQSTTLATHNECDSSVTLHLTVNPVSQSHMSDTIVENDLPYTFTGSVFVSDVSDTAIVVANRYGCDSTIHYSLTVNWNSRTVIDSTVCADALPLTWNAATFDTSTLDIDNPVTIVHSATLNAADGSDSIVDMRLHVNPLYNDQFYDTLCYNQLPYNWNTLTFDTILAANTECRITHSTTLNTVADCDSTVTMTLTVSAVTYSTYADTIVENQLPYIFNGATIVDSISDTTIVIQGVNGCDSNISYSLYVHRNVAASADSTVCADALPLTWNAVDFDTTLAADVACQISHTVTLTAHTGADSVLTMNLHVNPVFDLYYFDTICQNSFPYTWIDTVTGTPPPLPAADSTFSVYRSLNTLRGCDSLMTLHLFVLDTSALVIYDTIVENNIPYTFDGITFDTAITDFDEQIITHSAVNGCDSVVHYFLHVHRNVAVTADSSICQNTLPFVWNDVTFDTATATDFGGCLMTTTTTITAHTGADSVLTMNVIVMPNTASIWKDTIFERNLPYNFNGTLLYASHFADTSSYSDDSTIFLPRFSHLDTTVVIENNNGCDSVIEYTLYVVWNVHTSDDSTVCADMLPLAWNSRHFILDSTTHDTTLTIPSNDSIDVTFITYSSDSTSFDSQHAAFILFDTLPAASGADSIVSMRLHILPSYAERFRDTLCQAQSYVWYDDTLTVSGVYSIPHITTAGCDSSEFMHFSNYPNYDFTYYDTICDYSGTMRLGVEYIGVSYMNNMYGCDSNEVYHLWGLPVSNTNVDTIISDHLLPFTYEGYTFSDTAFAQMQFTLVNQYGCDSIVSFTLTVMPTVRIGIDSTICDDMLPLLWDSTLFDTTLSAIRSHFTMSRTDTLTTIYGADSIVTHILHVNPTFDITYIDTTCNGAPFSFADTTYDETGVYTHYFTTTAGCDSVETLQLQVNAMSYATQHDTIVENQLPFTFGGVTFTTTSPIVDSVITILNTVACDSVITYSLTVLTNTNVQRDTTVCFDALPLTWNSLTFNSSTLNSSNHSTISDSTVIILADGTDSVTYFIVNVNPTFNITDTVYLCEEQLPFTWNGITVDSTINNNFNAFTLYRSVTLTTTDGCDSIRNLILNVNPSPTTHDSIFSCDSYTWIDNNTYTTSTYGVMHPLQTIAGCDSTVVLDLSVAYSKTVELFDTICKGIEYPFGGVSRTETGIYVDSLATVDGCDSVVTLNLQVLLPPNIDIEWEYNCDTRIYTVHGITDANYTVWSSFPDDPTLDGQELQHTISVSPKTHETYMLFADYKDVPTCPNTDTVYLSPVLKPHAAIEYTPDFLTVEQTHLSLINRSTNELLHRWYVNGNDYGSNTRISYIANPQTDDSVVVVLTASYSICHDTASVVVPFRKTTLWTPNTFTPGESNNNVFYVFGTGITDYRIDLYTRGGALVWHSEDIEEGWDGTYNGKPCPQATYVYIIHYRDITAPKNELSKTGTVTLLR